MNTILMPMHTWHLWKSHKHQMCLIDNNSRCNLPNSTSFTPSRYLPLISNQRHRTRTARRRLRRPMSPNRRTLSIPACHRTSHSTPTKRAHITTTNPTSSNLRLPKVHLKDIHTTLRILAMTHTDSPRININPQTRDNSTTRLNNTNTTPILRICTPAPRRRHRRITVPCINTRIRLRNHTTGMPIQIPCPIPSPWTRIRSTTSTRIPERTKTSAASLRNPFSRSNSCISRRHGNRLACTLARPDLPLNAFQSTLYHSLLLSSVSTIMSHHLVILFLCIRVTFRLLFEYSLGFHVYTKLCITDIGIVCFALYDNLTVTTSSAS